MIQTCSKCKNYDISISDEPCRKCQQAFRRGEGKPNFIASITNADLLRALSDEELAVQLALPYLAIPPWCSVHITCPYISEDPTPCDKCALDWLKQEAASDG